MMPEHEPTSGLRPFPRVLGPAWLFLVWLDVGTNWPALAMYGCVPWLTVLVIWNELARTTWAQGIQAGTIDKAWRSAAVVMWIIVFLWGGGIFYANHYYPKGRMIETGGEVCESINDRRERCGPERIEDMRNLAVPNWVKFLKDRNYSEGLLFLFFAIAGFASSRPKGGYRAT